MATTVSTGGFEGPIDLLLRLVTAHEVDLYDIPLAEIVHAFVLEATEAEAADLSTLSEFLMVAALLVELKSIWLLPGDDSTEPEEELTGWEERDVLLARLLECQAYAAAADSFIALIEQAARSAPRTAGLDDRFAFHGPDLLEGVTPEQLATAFVRAAAERPLPVIGLDHVTVDAVSVAETVSDLEARLPALRVATFRQLTAHLATRIEVIVHFLALLELCNRGRVGLDQGRTFGELSVTWTAAESDRSPAVVGSRATDEYEG
ncbi:MAG: segregation and condensation protein A [Acidimicrobiales bacterium]